MLPPSIIVDQFFLFLVFPISYLFSSFSTPISFMLLFIESFSCICVGECFVFALIDSPSSLPFYTLSLLFFSKPLTITSKFDFLCMCFLIHVNIRRGVTVFHFVRFRSFIILIISFFKISSFCKNVI